MTNPNFDSLPELDAMRQGVTYQFKVTCRGFSVSLRPLSMNEILKVMAETQEFLNTMSETARNRLNENVIYAKKTLMFASTSDVGKSDMKLTGKMFDLMTDREVQFLYGEYCAGCDRVDPALEKLKPEIINELAENIKKNPSTATALSFLELVSVCQKLARTESPEGK